MSDYKLEFKLKQHTPIIHFQADQKGATLRATELKPKLDRFLIKELKLTKIVKKNNKDIEVPKNDYKSWFIGGGKEHLALNYKVKILANEKQIKPINESLFFANKLLDKKLKATFSETLEVTLSSFKVEMIVQMKEWIDVFFAVHNFGMRQNKGYGSFYRMKPTINFIDALKKVNTTVYTSSKSGSNFERIVDNIHKRLKSGLNPKANNGRHERSLLFKYVCVYKKQNICWEKRKIKQTFNAVLRPYYKKPIFCHEVKNDKFRYIRVVLGLAEHNEYNQGPKKGGERICISHGIVKRFKSPITYKVYNNEVYLIFNKSYLDLFKIEGKYTFEFDKEEFTLATLKKDEFSMKDFLDYVVVNDNIIKEVTP